MGMTTTEGEALRVPLWAKAVGTMPRQSNTASNL
jgi:hypothetical protein